VQQLVARGIGHTAVCERLGLDLKTVHRYVRAASPEDLLAPRATSLDPYKPYLAERYAEGCTDGARLWAEVREQGYGGCRRSVRRYLNTLGTGVQPPRAAEFTVRQVSRWTLRRPDRLEQEDREHLQTICARCPTLATATQLAQDFARLLRERRGVQHLVAWVAEVEASDIPELHAFAAGLRKDWAARSPRAAPCPGAPAPWRATSTGSRCSSDRCSAARTWISSSVGSWHGDRRQHRWLRRVRAGIAQPDPEFAKPCGGQGRAAIRPVFTEYVPEPDRTVR
jgi:hypothetical protein